MYPTFDDRRSGVRSGSGGVPDHLVAPIQLRYDLFGQSASGGTTTAAAAAAAAAAVASARPVHLPPTYQHSIRATDTSAVSFALEESVVAAARERLLTSSSSGSSNAGAGAGAGTGTGTGAGAGSAAGTGRGAAGASVGTDAATSFTRTASTAAQPSTQQPQPQPQPQGTLISPRRAQGAQPASASASASAGAGAGAPAVRAGAYDHPIYHQGYPPAIVDDAVSLYSGNGRADLDKANMFCRHYMQMLPMGFDALKIREALYLNDADFDRALKFLLVPGR